MEPGLKMVKGTALYVEWNFLYQFINPIKKGIIKQDMVLETTKTLKDRQKDTKIPDQIRGMVGPCIRVTNIKIVNTKTSTITGTNRNTKTGTTMNPIMKRREKKDQG